MMSQEGSSEIDITAFADPLRLGIDVAVAVEELPLAFLAFAFEN